jgi:hypothetical protein
MGSYDDSGPSWDPSVPNEFTTLATCNPQDLWITGGRNDTRLLTELPVLVFKTRLFCGQDELKNPPEER